MAEASRSPRGVLPAQDFRRRFQRLILIAWTVPPVFGLTFLLFIGMFTPRQMAELLTTPGEPVFVLAWLAFALWYFRRLCHPVEKFLRNPERTDLERVEACLSRFPRHFWGMFLLYLLQAPSSVLLSARFFSGFDATPVHWFRIHLVALCVSIIVGLPLFFRILDLFGQVASALPLQRPHVTVKTKVFLIGALVPLLIDTMLVQYYWTRTGYFTLETFWVWLTLEVLAVLGSIMFVHSFRQSLQPLESLIRRGPLPAVASESTLLPRSTDELGVLTTGYRTLLQSLDWHRTILQIGARMTGTVGRRSALGETIVEVVGVCRRALECDQVILLLYEPNANALLAVGRTGASYEPQGHFRVPLDHPTVATWVFRENATVTVPEVATDPRVCSTMRDHFKARSVLATPLRVDGNVIGVIVAMHIRHAVRYGDYERSLIQALAHEAAIAVHRHVLERQHEAAEASRREREEQVRLLLDHSAEAIFGADLGGRCTFVNAACLRMLGYAREEELLGRNMHELIHHSFADGTPFPQAACTVGNATRNGKSAHSDREVHWRADGTSFPVEWWSRPVYKDGQIIGAVVNFIDITQRRRSEATLHRLSAYNRLLLESTSDGIFGVDRALRCTFANRAAGEMLGISPDELLGRDMHALAQHSSEDGCALPREECLIWRCIREETNFWSDGEVLWRRGGEAFPVQYSANPIREHDRVTGAVVVFRDVAEARAMARQMDYLATHDPLTGLANRRELERLMERALASARRDSVTHALCYMDLDQFKVVNDSCGHMAGDELLRQLTALFHGKVRQSDTLARLGGDEFGLLLESCPIEEALLVANALRDVVQNFRFTWEGRTFSVSVSIGVVSLTADTPDLASALSAADAACYMAKDAGRNRLHLCQCDDAQLTERRGEMQWVSRIRQALDEDRLTLEAQPIVPLAPDAAGCRLRFEVLVRMLGDDGGSIPPGAFLPAAERYNLASDVDRWVLRNTFACLHRHRAALSGLDLCTINLSGQSIGDAQMRAYIVEQLEALSLPAQKICFEVTETAAVANLTEAVRFMHQLKTFGCRFALDDFGSGMSSFAYLKNLPVDYLKIDGNFVSHLSRQPVDRAMVEAINQVGHVMGIRTIAEFVEDAETLQALIDIGVDYAQGFGVGRPAPLEAVIRDAQAASPVDETPGTLVAS